jgi:hypothetical protein
MKIALLLVIFQQGETSAHFCHELACGMLKGFPRALHLRGVSCTLPQAVGLRARTSTVTAPDANGYYTEK